MVFVQVRDDGSIVQAALGFTAPPFGGAVEAPDDVATAPDRWFLVGGRWVFCPPIRLLANPTPAPPGAIVEVVAELGDEALDAEVLFSVGGEAVVEPVADGQATHHFAFQLPGRYLVTAFSPRHGSASVEVVVE